MVFSPLNQTRIWYCEHCHWKSEKIDGDFIPFFGACPHCGEDKLTLKTVQEDIFSTLAKLFKSP